VTDVTRIRLSTQLRAIFGLFTLLLGLASVYAWTDRSTATDAVWVYRLGMPFAGVWLFVGGVLRPRIGHTANLFVPFTLLALFRIADFMQDWFWTPDPDGETVDLFTRSTAGAFGWAFGASAVALFAVYDRLLLARFPAFDDQMRQ